MTQNAVLPDGGKSRPRELLEKYLREIGGFDPSEFSDGARIDSELKMKSVTFVEIRVALEEELDVEIDAFQVIDLNRLDKIAEYLEELVAEAAGTMNGGA